MSGDAPHLLLVAADDHTPTLARPVSVTGAARHPTSAAGAPTHLWSEGDHPDDLAAQRWAVFAPEGPTGDALLEPLAPLIAHRSAQQGADAKILRVPAGLDAAAAARWKKQALAGVSRLISEVPRYHLLLGDLDQVSLELQTILAADGFVGRLAFDARDHYAAYVDKLLRAERAAASPVPRAIFHTVHDGTPATSLGYQALLKPGLALAQTALPTATLVPSGDAEPDLGPLVRLARVTQPTVLFSLSHGEGAPRGGWRTAGEQRARQGAMSFGRAGRITGDDLARAAFLPDGVWLMLACFSAGTPQASKYQRWLAELAAQGQLPGNLDAVTASLPVAGGPAFVAALPKAALANPQGPLAFIGHIDLAWSYSFRELDGPTAFNRPGRFVQAVTALLRGRRVGVAFRELFRFFEQTNTELTALEESGDRDPLRRAHLWMLRQDLAGFVVLGDPAARLPVSSDTSKPAAAPAPDPAAFFAGMQVTRPPAAAASFFPGMTVTPAAPAPDTERLERAIGQVLADPRALASAAQQAQLDPRALADLVERYRRGGRAAIGRA